MIRLQSTPAKKKYLGTLDPDTLELIPSSGKPGRKPGSKNRKPIADSDTVLLEQLEAMQRHCRELESAMQELRDENHSLRQQVAHFQNTSRRIVELLST